MSALVVPADFPRSAPLGSVPGAQPKLLVQRQGSGLKLPDDSDTEARYEVCADLVQQLLTYSVRKRLERPDWTKEQVCEKVIASTRQRAFAWGLSPAETEWVVDCFKSRDEA